MLRMAAALSLAIGFSACDAVNTATEGFKHAKDVETDLERSTGVRPQVGFNWHNGRLVSVTVAFPGIYETKPLRDVAEAVRTSVSTQFKPQPETIVLAFSLRN